MRRKYHFTMELLSLDVNVWGYNIFSHISMVLITFLYTKKERKQFGFCSFYLKFTFY